MQSDNASNGLFSLFERRIMITRVFNAAPGLVFRAWTEPEHLLRWYAPQGCTVRFSHIDVRTGGTFLCCISNPQHGNCWCRGAYKEVSEPERLVYTLTISDEHGNRVNPADVGMDPDWPGETEVTVTFMDLGGATKLVLQQAAPEELARRTGAYNGWLQMLDNLSEELKVA